MKIGTDIIIGALLMLVFSGCVSAHLQADEYTKILMHFDNGQGSTNIIDDTGRVWTSSSGATQSNYTVCDNSTSSLSISSASTQYVKTVNTTGLNVTDQDFTIEFYARRNSFGVQRIFGNMDSDLSLSNTTIDVQFLSTDKMRFSIGNGTTYKAVTSTSAVTDKNWHEYKLQRSGRYLIMWKDGRYWGLTDIGNFSAVNSSVQYAVGCSGVTNYLSFNGSIDEFRYSTGISRVSSNWMDWYAFGDSNTDATNAGLNPADGSWCYVYTLGNSTFETAEHCIGGYGQLSSWGKTNVEAYYPHPRNYIIMFGSNDAHTGVTAAAAAQNVKDIYNYTTVKGSKTIICVPLMSSDVGGYYALAYQQQWLTDFEHNLSGYPYIKAYDSTDSIPDNGYPDAINASMFESDGRHLNEQGQVALGRYIYNNVIGNCSTDGDTFVASSNVGFHYTNNIVPSSIAYDFENDGTIDTTNVNTSHMFSRAGVYAVNVTVQNVYGKYSTVKDITVTLPFTLESDGNITTDVYAYGSGHAEWVESSETHDVLSHHIMGGFPDNSIIQIKRDGTNYAKVTSNSTGYIDWTYSGGYSEHTFEADVLAPNDFDTSRHTASDTWIMIVSLLVIIVMIYPLGCAMRVLRGQELQSGEMTNITISIVALMLIVMIGYGLLSML